MSATLVNSQVEILRLPKAERARLLDRSVASLDGDDPATEAEWHTIADAREAELQRGEVQALARDAAMQQLQARFPATNVRRHRPAPRSAASANSASKGWYGRPINWKVAFMV